MSLQSRLAASAKNISLAIFASLVSLELFSFAATKFELLPFKDVPEIYQPRDSVE